VFECADSTHVLPEERLRELAAILALGVVRLRRLVTLREQAADNPADLPATGLAVSEETVLSVHTG